jgi:hypothetical protein
MKEDGDVRLNGQMIPKKDLSICGIDASEGWEY